MHWEKGQNMKKKYAQNMYKYPLNYAQQMRYPENGHVCQDG
jgi:hypothetical protein